MRAIRSLLFTAAILAGLNACSDATLPLEPRAAAANGLGAAAFESRESVSLAADAEVYLVGVYFDESNYLVQVGVRRAGSAALTLHQGRYELQQDGMTFEGGVLDGGRLVAGGTALETTVLLEGKRLRVRLARR